MTADIKTSNAPDGTDHLNCLTAVHCKELLGDGTELYQRTMAEWASEDDGGELMRQVWSPTPWMISVDVGIGNDERRREIRNWCNRNLGNETIPYGEHRQGGAWIEGNVTIMGKTWYGFKTKEMMERFQQRFPSPNAAMSGTDQKREN